MTWAEAGLATASIALLLSVMAVVHRLARRFDWSAELQRKTVHVATGVYALCLPLLFADAQPVMILMGVAVAIMLVMRLPVLVRSGPGAALHGIGRTSYGDLLFAVAIAATFFQAQGEAVLYLLPIAVLTLSDAAAALTGIRYGRQTFTVEATTKSVEGSTIFFLVTWLLAMVALLLLTDVDRPNVVLLGLAVAAFGTLVEADSWRGFDNLFIPVGLQLFLIGYLDADLGALAGAIGSLLGLILALMLIGTRLGLTSHAARAYAVLMFLILTTTSVYNAFFAVAVLAAHLYARSRRPCRAAFPDLDMLAAMALIALFWLVFGEWFQQNAINLFNLTFAALALALVSTAGIRTLPLGLPIAATLLIGVELVADGHGDHTRWYGALWPWSALALTVAWIAPRVRRSIFDNSRSLRLSGVALSVPLTVYTAFLVTP